MEYKLQNFLDTGFYEANVKDNQLIDNYLGSKDNKEIWAAVDEILKIKMA